MKFEIKSRFSGAVLFSLETESIKLCVEAAVKSRADLRGANLDGADLYGANLCGANLDGADLYGADLCGANLDGADLYGANLCGADLRGAYVRGAYLRGADLRGAKLKYGDIDLVLVGERPILQLGPMGSRSDYLLAFITDGGVYVRAGCFWDTLEHFAAAVKEQHGTNVHAVEYKAAISLIKTHAKLWSAS